MKFRISNRQCLFAAIFIFYLIPFLFFSIYSIQLMSYHKSWGLLSIGLLLVAFGSLSLIFLLSFWEQEMRDKKIVHSLLLSQQSPSLSPMHKEEKVTLLDPSLIWIDPNENISKGMGQDSSEELNLLQAALQSSQRKQEEVTKSLEIKILELQKQEEENKQLQIKAQLIGQDFSDYKLFSEEQLKQKQLQLKNLQQVIEDQKAEMEKRQEQIHQLDSKVHDLSYEIKTLLYLHEEESISHPSNKIKENLSSLAFTEQKDREQILPANDGNLADNDSLAQVQTVRTPLEADSLLKKCIHIAQKLTGANYYPHGSSRYREFSSSYYAIDQRRLFDSLRSESGALVIMYSQKDHKLLFVNGESKTLLGWSSEKFLTDFSSIIQEGMHEWKKAIHSLSNASESQVRCLAKTKQGQEVLLNCNLGVIQSGLFRNYIIGVLYPAKNPLSPGKEDFTSDEDF